MRILVIEDEKDVADFIGRSLTDESHAVDVFHDGREGEEMALSEQYDLVILDIMLPGKDGVAILRTLREEGLETPVLLLTARSSVEDRVKGLDAGADDYLGKPFALAELRARVRALLRRNASEKNPVLCIASVRLDPAAHEVRVNDRHIDLTNREFAILEYLMRNKGRMLTKGMIAEHVWDYHFDSDYNLIEVYIRRLRQKIEAPAGVRLIHTIRNGGYVLREPEE